MKPLKGLRRSYAVYSLFLLALVITTRIAVQEKSADATQAMNPVRIAFPGGMISPAMVSRVRQKFAEKRTKLQGA